MSEVLADDRIREIKDAVLMLNAKLDAAHNENIRVVLGFRSPEQFQVRHDDRAASSSLPARVTVEQAYEAYVDRNSSLRSRETTAEKLRAAYAEIQKLRAEAKRPVLESA
jgi:hypothetical protein